MSNPCMFFEAGSFFLFFYDTVYSLDLGGINKSKTFGPQQIFLIKCLHHFLFLELFYGDEHVLFMYKIGFVGYVFSCM